MDGGDRGRSIALETASDVSTALSLLLALTAPWVIETAIARSPSCRTIARNVGQNRP